MDFAIIEANGKQYKITPTSEIEIEHMDIEVGKKVTFDKVLMVVEGDKVEMGTPYLEGQSFEAEVSAQTKGDKIKILRFRAKSRHRRRVGFRSQITKVSFGEKKAQAKSTKKTEVKTEVKTAKKTPAKTSTRKTAKKAE